MSQAFYTDTQQREVLRIIPDLIHSRRLLRDLVSKEFRAYYRSTLVGVVWAVLHPLLMMSILTFVFGVLLNFTGGRLSPANHTYASMLLCGLVPWQFFSAAIIAATNSLVANQELIKKVYFPREVVPLSAIINCVTNLVIGFLTLLIVIALLEGPRTLGAGMLWLPVIFAVQFALITGLGLLFSSLNVFYRDVRFMVEIGLAFGFYATPVFYDLSALSFLNPWLYRLYMLNPMAHLVTAYRQALLDNRMPDLAYLIWPAVMSAAIVVLGVYVFRRRAPVFADFF
jgi:ABC-type polysaccharide/polyol phosphate export permease